MPELPEAAVDAALARRSDLLADRPDPMVLSERRLVTLMLEAAAPILAEAVAQKILAHMERHLPPGSDRNAARREHSRAAKVAELSFSDREAEVWMPGVEPCGRCAACAPFAVTGWGTPREH